MKYCISQLVTKDNVQQVPEELIHFYATNRKYLVVPLDLNCSDMEIVQREFGNYNSIEDLNSNKNVLSNCSQKVLEIFNTLELKNILIEHVESVGDHYPLYEFIQFIIKDGKIIKDSTISNVDEEGDLYSESFLGYDNEEILFKSYKNAEDNYFNELKS